MALNTVPTYLKNNNITHATYIPQNVPSKSCKVPKFGINTV